MDTQYSKKELELIDLVDKLLNQPDSFLYIMLIKRFFETLPKDSAISKNLLISLASQATDANQLSVALLLIDRALD